MSAWRAAIEREALREMRGSKGAFLRHKMLATAQTVRGSYSQTIPAPEGNALVRIENLRKIFQSGSADIAALDGVDLAVERGEMVAIIGPSGAGKSTLLHLLGALDTPTSGEVYFAGKLVADLSPSELSELRGGKIGFVWQRHHLLPDFTAAENVAMPLRVRGVSPAEASKTAVDWLGKVGLASRASSQVSEFSGGEQQRVAIARALAGGPELLLADEPTGDLDGRNGEAVFELMRHLHQTLHLTSILATHNLSLARRADRVFLLESGGLRAVDPAVAPWYSHPDAAEGGSLPGTGEQVTRV